jgi:nucleoside-diphosphate-sugar epimerase
MDTIAIVGGSGYIGKHVVEQLLLLGSYRIRLLSRRLHAPGVASEMANAVEIVQGDLLDKHSLKQFLVANCTVINLVYMWEGGEAANITATENLISACQAANVRRLIHCSTAAVVGRVPDDNVTELTVCRPVTEYGITKLKIEDLFVMASSQAMDVAILRPTGVFGPGGAPLSKLAGDLTKGSRFKNYLKSCLFGKRRMNLVHVSNVVAAITFLIDLKTTLDGEIFIVSDDDSQGNNFVDIERTLMNSMGQSEYFFPRVGIPLAILSLILKCLGRNNVNPRCNYRQGKLEQMGFRRKVDFQEGLQQYASWYQEAVASNQSRILK